jgi:hypothetical protein
MVGQPCGGTNYSTVVEAVMKTKSTSKSKCDMKPDNVILIEGDGKRLVFRPR